MLQKTNPKKSNIALSIDNLVVYAPEHTTFANNDSFCKFASIPANLKRRCSKASKIALEAANRAKGQKEVQHAVFCSQHGELDCAVNLLQDIAHKQLLSPMEFSQSVHNTAAGLFSVMHNFNQDTVTIAAGENTFLMGMLEAFTWLQLNPGKTLLLVIFNAYMPVEYQAFNDIVNDEYAVAFLLVDNVHQENSVSFSIQAAANERQNTNKKTPAALEFVEWFLHSATKELIQSATWQNFRWHRNDINS